MKLKELHLRNIASIECADIDFENGLNDAVTGEPAPIFLISGDTGAGKSIILDGIAMALYKKTPRVADVANVKQNEYKDAGGESIRVASIEQYTRLGISEKDECYSEVVFEGNDGKTYHARLTLGLKLGVKDKATGVRPLKHRSPLWEVRAGDGDWTKDSVEQTILQAVGLDFQQFGRMAMLAQGQFANFLTGDKKEREAILEQLTNTQHFTAYGEAIASLWKQRKEAQVRIQTQYDTEKPHTLTDEQIGQITAEQQVCRQQIERYDQEIGVAETTLKLIDTVLANEKAQAEAQAALEQQEAAFRLLAADISDRQARMALQEDAVRQLEEWLEKRSQYKDLFSKAGETDLKIGQYLDKVKKSDQLSATLKQEKAQTDGLKKAAAEAHALAQEANHAVQEKQSQIDLLTRKRLALHPQAVNEELKRQYARRQALKDLQTQLDNLKPMVEENQSLQARLQSEETQLTALQAACQEADADYQAKKQNADKASQRLTTMQMSLEDKIKELRHRLYEEHAENCPLCGQHIEHIHLDDDFKNMLTPLEEELQQARERLQQAEALRDQAMGRLKQLAGTHKSTQDLYEANKKKIAQAQAAIDCQARELGLDAQKEWFRQIGEALGLLAEIIMGLESAQSEAEKLQSEINELAKGKRPYDTRKAEADKAIQEAENLVKANADAILRMTNELSELSQETDAVKADISTSLKDYQADWQEDIERLRRRLREDATVYAGQCKLLNDSQTNLEKAHVQLGTFVQYRQDILGLCPEWNTDVAPQAFPCGNINVEWTNLLGRVNSLVAKLKDCKAAIAASSGALAEEMLDREALERKKKETSGLRDEVIAKMATYKSILETHQANSRKLKEIEAVLEKARQQSLRWDRLNSLFGGTRFRTLVQAYILRPLLNNANIYLEQITDRYRLTCSEANEQLSILVLDRYNKNQVRSVTVLSGGERFMISLALSLALSSLNRPDMNVNILFIDEGFGTLDEKSLDSVMSTLEKLQEIAGQSSRRVGIISHREELEERIPVKIQVMKKGEGRSLIALNAC